MDKPTTSLGELKRVDPHAGRLRLLLCFAFILILWTLLAFIASIADPIKTLPTLWHSEPQTTSPTLAASLMGEIFGSYLSNYAVVHLFLFLLLVIASFLTSRAFLAEMLQLDSSKAAGKYLRSCAFHLPEYPSIDTQVDDFKKSDNYRIISTQGGPAYLTIPADCLALVSGRKSEVQALLSGPEDPETFLIEHGEKLSNLLLFRERQSVRTIHALCSDGRKAQLKSVRITYSLNKKCFENDEKEDARLLKEIVSIFQGLNWESFIEDSIQYELKSILMNYSSTEIGSMLEQGAGISPQLSSAANRSDKTHNLRSHRKRYSTPKMHAAQSDSSTILRNRRRSITPEMRDLKEVKVKEVIKKKVDPREILSEQISKSVNSLFSSAIIQIKIEEIGKVSFNEIH